MIDRPTLKVAAAALVAIAALAAAALAQRGLDGGQGGERAEGDRNVAGDFDYYTLVLSWSPSHCSTPEGEEDALQCRRQDGRRYAFVLHGLWPQYEEGFPESCRTRRRPFVPQPVIDGMQDIMPSPRLVIHEYRTHGTCSGLDPGRFFETARRLFEKIAIPQRFLNPFETQFVSPDDLIDELVDLNPGLGPDMLAVACDGGPGSRLRDVRICFTKDGDYRACGANEDQSRLCRDQKMHVPPVRSTK